MMGRQGGDQSQLFYLFNLERRIPACHLLRRVNPVPPHCRLYQRYRSKAEVTARHDEVCFNPETGRLKLMSTRPRHAHY
jgi:hypothetical protein